MCAICVEIARERIKIKDAVNAIREALKAGIKNDHQAEILGAWTANDDAELARLVANGVKQERWI